MFFFSFVSPWNFVMWSWTVDDSIFFLHLCPHEIFTNNLRFTFEYVINVRSCWKQFQIFQLFTMIWTILLCVESVPELKASRKMANLLFRPLSLSSYTPVQYKYSLTLSSPQLTSCMSSHISMNAWWRDAYLTCLLTVYQTFKLPRKFYCFGFLWLQLNVVTCTISQVKNMVTTPSYYYYYYTASALFQQGSNVTCNKGLSMIVLNLIWLNLFRIFKIDI